MSQVQGTTSPYYTMPWLYQSTPQSGPSATSADAFFGATGQAADPFASLGASAGASATSGQGAPTPPFSLGAMSALLAAQSQSTTGSTGLSPDQQKVFSELDTDGDGTITKSELENDFGAGNTQLADAVFSKLDTNGDGAISDSEFAAGTTKTAHHGHHHHGGGSGQSQDPLAALLGTTTPGQSSQTMTNSDGSTTTTITYADGTTVSTTSAPTATSGTSGTAATTSSTGSQGTTANLLEQLIQMQAQLTAASLSGATTMSI